MFSVGQFAQLAQISVRTLHHYDELGLLKPAAVDDATGYRSYEAAQLRDLNRVLALKELGFTLHEIGDVITAGVSGDELLGMLRLRQAEAERKAEQERERLARVAARIRLLSGHRNGHDGEAAIVVKPLEGMRLAAHVETIDDYDDVDFPVFIPETLQHQYEETLRLGMREPVGPIQAHFLRRDDGRIEVVTGVPVQPDEELESEFVVMLDLPDVDRAVTLVRQGHFAEGGHAAALLTEWLEATGQESAFDHYREVYLQAAGSPETWVAEYQFVLKDPV